MKKLFKLLYILTVLPFAVLSCAPEEVAAPGDPELYGCYEVYFPSQTNAKDHNLDPDDATILTFKASRNNTNGEVTVPVTVTCDGGEEGENIFEVSDIYFKDGQSTSTFTVEFADAEIGTTYSCSIEVEDPLYALKYGTNATYLSFSVTRVKWNRIYGPNGEEYGTYKDDIFGCIGFSLRESIFVNEEVEFYERDDKPGYYKIRNAYTDAMMAYLFEGSTDNAASYKGITRETDMIFDATDPNKVFMPLQSLGVNVNDEYGWIMAGSYHSNNIGIDESSNLYGILEDGIISFPVNGLVYIFPTTGSGSMVNSNGQTKLIFPGYKDADYSLALNIGSSDEDGILPFQVLMGADVTTVKYATFEGELYEYDIQAKASEITNGTVKSEKLSTSGIFGLQLDETGLYTLVTVGYNAAGEQVAVDGGAFGYVKKGDEVPVNLTAGLIVSDKYAKDGLTSENSMEFYVYGEDIKQFWIAMYPANVFEANMEGCISETIAYGQANEEMVDMVNAEGYSDIFVNLNAGTEYTLVVYAYNGYTETLFTETLSTKGTWDPLQSYYTMYDIYVADEKAQYCKEWEFYAGTPETMGRMKASTVTVEDGGQETSEEGDVYELLTVKNLFQPVTNYGVEFNDVQTWEYVDGLVFNVDGRFGQITVDGRKYYASSVSLFQSGAGGITGWSLIGALTAQGNVAFVDSGLFDEYGGFYGMGFYLFSDNTYETIAGSLLIYDDLLFVDPANLEKEEDESVAATKAKLNTIKKFYNMDYNCVETDRQQLIKAVQKFKDQSGRMMTGELAGIRTEIPHPQVEMSVEPYDKPFEAPEKEVKYFVDFK